MDNPSGVISVLKTCFVVCLTVTILFFVINVVLFFVFDIRTLFNIRTGRAKRKTIKEMQAANDSTGRLRVGGKTLTAQLDLPPQQPVSQTPKQQNTKKKSVFSTMPPPEPIKLPEGSNTTTVLQYEAAQTETLRKAQDVITSYDPGNTPTSQLTQEQRQASASQYQQNYGEDYGENKDIHFTITKYLVYIHTEERIV